MKLHYYPETDSLYIDLSDRTSEDSVEVTEEVVLDLDGSGQVTGIDIQHASKTVDLSALDVKGLPVTPAPLTRAPANVITTEAVSHSPAR